ncbi:MAG: hypothetical protein Fur0041_00250 [Bacteroidia bacterium]
MENNRPDVKLCFAAGKQVIRKIGLIRGQHLVLTIGKAEGQVDILISDPTVSRQHAQLIYDTDGNLFIQDIGSSNGTYVNGKRLQQGIPQKITAADSIYFSGNQNLTLAINPDENKFDQTSAEIENRGALQSEDIMEKFRNKNIVVIGRSADCDVVLNHSSVSRRHAAIERLSDGSFRVKDLNSLNGTYLNGKKLTGAEKVTEKDIILVGRFRISLRGAAADISKDVAIRAERIIKAYPNGYVGLKEMSFTIPSRSLLGIMGPSGCGKSTLMKALNGDSPITGGNVYLFNLELIKNYEFLKTQIGYVPQDDIVHRELTVEQSLYYAAHLRLDNPTNEFIAEKIEQVLNDLNIAHIRHNLVGKISGGQRKRVSIAVELLTDPLVMFLDEPTSPLDPQTIEEFLGILRKLAQRGTTVVMVTHKPEDLNYMDSVMFLAEGGHLVYYGSTDGYKEYFGVKNSVDVYANIAGDRAKQWVDKYNREHPHPTGTPEEATSKPERSKVSFFGQYRWLTARYLKIKTNDRVNTAIMIAQAPIIAGLICLIFKDIVQSVPFLMAICAIWFGANNAAREIVSELPIYKRERMFNMMIPTYILSKLTVLGFFSAIQSVLFIGIVSLNYSGATPEWNDPIGSFNWMLVLALSSTLMGLMLSAVVDTAEKVMTLVPLALIPQIMLAGLVAKIKNPVVEYISYGTLSRWGTEGFSILQDTVRAEVMKIDTAMIKPDTAHPGKVIIPDPVTDTVNVSSVEVLHKQFHPDYKETFTSAGEMSLDYIAVGVISVIFLAGIYYALKKKDSIPNMGGK